MKEQTKTEIEIAIRETSLMLADQAGKMRRSKKKLTTQTMASFAHLVSSVSRLISRFQQLPEDESPEERRRRLGNVARYREFEEYQARQREQGEDPELEEDESL
jgi:hypothetical protein